jgi:hypothetical protein
MLKRNVPTLASSNILGDESGEFTSVSRLDAHSKPADISLAVQEHVGSVEITKISRKVSKVVRTISMFIAEYSDKWNKWF